MISNARHQSAIWWLASTLLLAATLATWHQRLAAASEPLSSAPAATSGSNSRQTSASESSGPQVSAPVQSASPWTSASSTSAPVPCSITKPPAGESLEAFLKLASSAEAAEQAMNATERLAHESARCRSNTDSIRFWPPSVVAQQRPKTLAAMQPGDSIDRWLFLGREPRWMNECNIRQPNPIPVLVPSVRREMLESEMANQESVLHASSVEPRRPNATLNLVAGSIGGRSKRSAPTAHNLHASASRRLYKFQDASSPILFRTKYSLGAETRAGGSIASTRANKLQPTGGNAAGKWLKPKKTTFNLSGWPKQKLALKHSKTRLLVSADLNQVDSPNQQRINASRMQTMFEQLHQLDYDINRKLTETYETEKNLSDFIGKIYNQREAYLNESNKTADAMVSQERRQQIRDERSLWMPPIRELVLAGEVNEANLFNLTGGLYNGQVEFLMSNMTKYIELFLVAVEQMLYDQDELSASNDLAEKKNMRWHYQDLEAKTQLLLCEAKVLLQMIAQWREIRRSFIEMLTIMTKRGEVLKLKESDTGDFFTKLINQTLFRDQPPPESFQYIESPLALAWARLDPSARHDKLRLLESYLPENRNSKRSTGLASDRATTNGTTPHTYLSYPTHFWREIMPLKQRQLLSATERAVRDLSILDEMKQFLRSYKSLIFNNVPADTNLLELYSA